MTITTTLNRIRARTPCADGLAKLLRHASSLLRWLLPPTATAGDVMAYAGPMPCGCDVPRVTVVGASSRSVRFEWGDETQEIRGRRSFARSFKKIR